MSREQVLRLPDYLRSTGELIERSFPGGVAAEQRMALLKLLSVNMSRRSLAQVAAAMMEMDLADAYNAALGVDAYQGAEEVVSGVEARLRRHGYEEWLAEQD
jgi:hypothetical protein